MQPHWTRGHVIGQGSSATVSAATAHLSGEVFAVKSAELSNSEPLQREQKILSTISCPQVVNYRGFDITSENHKLMYNLHLEYIPNGTLFDAMKKGSIRLNESLIRYYTKEILQGLEFLYAGGIVHCDIKSKNILVSETGVKIADFGCAKRVNENMPFGGTPLFMAPEVARGEEQGCACDIWALGCTVIEMATGGSPWPKADDPAAFLYRIAYIDEVPEIPRFLSEEAKDFLQKCLKRNCKERWTAAELLKHPFLSKGVSDSDTVSPTSVLDHGFWNSIEDSSRSVGNLVCTSSCSSSYLSDRIRQLTIFSVESGWKDDEDWITVRENCDDHEGGMCCSVSANCCRGELQCSVDCSDNLNFQESKLRWWL